MFNRFARASAELVGSPVAFLAALVIVAAWVLCGPLFRFSDTWQLIINTASSIVTTLVVFLIQNSQNRDTLALHAKLDQLILASQNASSELIQAENFSTQELQELRDRMVQEGRSSPSDSR